MGGGTRSLRAVGLIYPPVQQAGKQKTGNVDKVGRDREHIYEEFWGNDEISWLAENVVGKPLCVDHDFSRQVGHVEDAEVTHCGAVKVTVKIDGTTENGADMVQRVDSKEYTALSLSHACCYEASALVRNGVVREIREVSLCKVPRRDGCFVHHVTNASAEQQVDGDINNSQAPVVNEENITVLNCSIIAEEMEGDVPTTTGDATAPVDSTPEPAAAVAAPETTTEPATEPTVDAAVEETADKPADEAMEVDDHDATAELIRQATERLAEQDEKLKEMMATVEKATANAKDMEEKATQAQKKLDDEKKRANEEAKRLQKQAEVSQKARIKALGQQLQSRLSNKINVPEPKTDAEMLAYNEQLLTAAIKEQDDLKNKNNNMDQQARGLKRENAEMMGAIDNFGTGNRRILVNASAEPAQNEPSSKRLHTESILEMYRNNKGKVSMRDLQEHAQRQKGCFLVNASADQPHADEAMVDMHGNIRIGMQDLYPELHKSMVAKFSNADIGPSTLKRLQDDMYYIGAGLQKHDLDLRRYRDGLTR